MNRSGISSNSSNETFGARDDSFQQDAQNESVEEDDEMDDQDMKDFHIMISQLR